MGARAVRLMLFVLVVAIVVLPASPLEAQSDAPKPFVTSLDRATGEPRWTVSGDTPGVWRLIGVSGDLVFLAQLACTRVPRGGVLVAREQTGGKERWRAPFTGSPYDLRAYSVHGARVLLIQGDRLVALDALSGERRWDIPLQDFRPRGGDDQIVLIENHVEQLGTLGAPPAPFEVRAIARATGRRIWTYTSNISSSPPYVYGDLALVDRHTVVGDFTESLRSTVGEQVGIDANSGRALWSVPRNQQYVVKPGAGVLFGSQSSGISAFDPRTREPRWATAPTPPRFLQVVVDGRVIANSPGVQAAFDVRDGSLLWERHDPTSGEVTAAGRGLLVFAPPSGASGDVVAVDVPTGAARWQQAKLEGGGLTWLVGRGVYAAGGCAAVDET